jgi:hypothetical protein
MRRSASWPRLAAVLAVLLVAAPLAAQDCLQYGNYFPEPAPTGPRIAAVGGVQAVAVSGSVLALGSDTGLQLWDVSDPLLPLWLGEAPILCDRLVAKGDVLYAARYAHGIQAIDISDPTAPRVTEVIRHERGTYDLVIHREHLLVTPNFENPDLWFGVVVYDLADPRHPQFVTEVGGGAGFSICLSGDDLVLANYDPVYANQSFLLGVDVSDPEQPVYYPQGLQYPGRTRDVASSGHHVYAVTDTHGLYVIDVADMAAPAIVTVMPELTGAWSVAVAEQTLWVMVRGEGGENTLVALSLADPAAPQLLDGVAYQGDEVYHAAGDGWLYLATDEPAPVLVEIADPTQPRVHAWTVVAPGHFASTGAGVVGSGDLIFLGSELGDPLQVFDVSDPAGPQQIAGVPGDLLGGGVARSDTLLAQLVRDPEVTSNRWLDLYSVDDPLAPRLLGRGEVGAYARYLAMTDEAAYAAGPYDIHVLDLRDPAHPQYVKSLDPGSGSMRGLVREGSYLYVVSGTGGLVILDLADPFDPQPAATVPLDACYAAAVQGDLCFAYDWYFGLCTIDVTDPHAPVILHEEALEQVTIWAAALDGDQLVLVNAFAEASIYDVADPLAPRLTGRFDPIAIPGSIAVAGRWLALAAGEQGLQLAWRPCPAAVAAPQETPGAVARLDVAPNPFNPRATITFALGAASEVSLSIHDLAGRRIARPVDRWLEEGRHRVVWNGRDEAGRAMPSGTYLVRLRTARGVRTVKAMLVR